MYPIYDAYGNPTYMDTSICQTQSPSTPVAYMDNQGRRFDNPPAHLTPISTPRGIQPPKGYTFVQIMPYEQMAQYDAAYYNGQMWNGGYNPYQPAYTCLQLQPTGEKVAPRPGQAGSCQLKPVQGQQTRKPKAEANQRKQSSSGPTGQKKQSSSERTKQSFSAPPGQRNQTSSAPPGRKKQTLSAPSGQKKQIPNGSNGQKKQTPGAPIQRQKKQSSTQKPWGRQDSNAKNGPTRRSQQDRSQNSKTINSEKRHSVRISGPNDNSKPTWHRVKPRNERKSKKRADLRPRAISREASLSDRTLNLSKISLNNLEFGDYGSVSLTDTMIDDLNMELGNNKSYGSLNFVDDQSVRSVSRLLKDGDANCNLEVLRQRSEKHQTIEKINDWLEIVFGEGGHGIYGRENTTGKDIVRVDVKSIAGLGEIKKALQKLEVDTRIKGVSTRFSVKRSGVCKGMSIYVKFATAKDVKKCNTLLLEGIKKKLWKARIVEKES